MRWGQLHLRGAVHLISRLRRQLPPVSYTHLDVYKRQVDDAAAVGCADVTGVPLAAGDVRKGFRILCRQTEGACDDSSKMCIRDSPCNPFDADRSRIGGIQRPE